MMVQTLGGSRLVGFMRLDQSTRGRRRPTPDDVDLLEVHSPRPFPVQVEDPEPDEKGLT